jgi:hypothetical protein
MFEFLEKYRISEQTLPILNTTIDRATDALQVCVHVSVCVVDDSNDVVSALAGEKGAAEDYFTSGPEWTHPAFFSLFSTLHSILIAGTSLQAFELERGGGSSKASATPA